MPELWDWFARGAAVGFFVGLVVMAAGCLWAVRARAKREGSAQ